MDSRGRIPVQLPAPNPTPSYWHEPKAAIANYRSADGLPSSVDYVIIGSGISGTMAAWNLLEKGVKGKIVMLEAREAISAVLDHRTIAEMRALALADDAQLMYHI